MRSLKAGPALESLEARRLWSTWRFWLVSDSFSFYRKAELRLEGRVGRLAGAWPAEDVGGGSADCGQGRCKVRNGGGAAWLVGGGAPDPPSRAAERCARSAAERCARSAAERCARSAAERCARSEDCDL